MWSRVVEVMLGCWLMISPFVFHHPSSATALWTNDLSCGAAVAAFALLSYVRQTHHAHLLSIIVAVWLIAFAYWQGFGSASPASQNHAIIGLLLGMFAVIPNNAGLPAAEWETATTADSSTESESGS